MIAMEIIKNELVFLLDIFLELCFKGEFFLFVYSFLKDTVLII